MAHVMGQILQTLGGIGMYLSFLLIRPQHRCQFCSGWGVKGGRRKKACRWCRGTGIRFWPGARLVHRGAALAKRYILEFLRDRRYGP